MNAHEQVLLADAEFAADDLGRLIVEHAPPHHVAQGRRQCVDARQRALRHTGTSIYAAFALDTPRTLDGVRSAYSVDAGPFGVEFNRTTVPLRLMTSAIEGLESRAQARRVCARLGEFRRAEIDFGGVTSVGHAFADELFRVFGPAQHALELVPVNMTPAVAALVASVQGHHPRSR